MLTAGVTNVLTLSGGVLQGETTFPAETGASAGGGRQGGACYLEGLSVNNGFSTNYNEPTGEASLPHTVVRGGFGMFTGPLPYSAYNHAADIAPFSPTFVIPLIWVSNFVYETPSLSGHNLLLRGALGGWELSTIYTLQTGRPFGIGGGANGGNNSGAFQGGDRADVVPNVIASERQGGRSNWLNHYITPGSFQPNAPGTFGNSAPNL